MSKTLKAYAAHLRTYVAALILIGSFAACGNQDNGHSENGDAGIPATLDQYLSKLQECGVMSDGRVSRFESESCESVCLFDAVVAGSCDDVVREFCGDQPVWRDECFEECSFICDDGTAIPGHWECDEEVDCPDESDETNCPAPFVCGDGTEIPNQWICDGPFDCGDESDEAGCPRFVCGDGSDIAIVFECDEFLECSDGSDEFGCATLQCNGETEPSSHCNCCACEFADDDIQCGAPDFDCTECIELGGRPAADCSVCAGICFPELTLCEDDPNRCGLAELSSQSSKAVAASISRRAKYVRPK